MGEMKARLPQFFSAAALPKSALVVKAVEPFREKSAGKAFYQDPPPDGSRPGIYYVNLYDMADMPKTEIEALAFHEGLPGHHLERVGAVAARRPSRPSAASAATPLRARAGASIRSGSAKDMGFYTDPYRDFGRLQLELHRAIRLVVDTGLHHKRWTREQAIDYVEDNSADAPGGIVKAIERYVVYPGQATAYMVGQPQDHGAARARPPAARRPVRHQGLPRRDPLERRGAARCDGAQRRRVDRLAKSGLALPAEHELAQGPRVVEGVVRDAAVLGRAEAGSRCGIRSARLPTGAISAGPVTISAQKWAMSSGQSATIIGSGSAAR